MAPSACVPYLTPSSHLLVAMVTSGQLDMFLDGQEGRQLIRVILQFIMSDDPQLTSKSVKLLIRQFSQRKELIAGFKQVCTLALVSLMDHLINWIDGRKISRSIRLFNVVHSCDGRLFNCYQCYGLFVWCTTLEVMCNDNCHCTCIPRHTSL